MKNGNEKEKKASPLVTYQHVLLPWEDLILDTISLYSFKILNKVFPTKFTKERHNYIKM